MRVALVTGASRGLGRHIALVLGRNGYVVVVNYLSAEKEASGLIKTIGGDSLAVRADIGDPDQVRGMSELIGREYGRLDVIVNNAGVTKDNLLVRQSEEDWDAVIRTNLKGCFNVIRTLAPIMVKSGGGHIINISSRSGVSGKAGQAAYSASKAALLGLTYTAAAELAADRIRVNAILPGYMMTEMGAGAGRAMEAAKQKSILKSLSDPAEVAALVLYLLNTGTVSGQVFSLDSRLW